MVAPRAGQETLTGMNSRLILYERVLKCFVCDLNLVNTHWLSDATSILIEVVFNPCKCPSSCAANVTAPWAPLSMLAGCCNVVSIVETCHRWYHSSRHSESCSSLAPGRPIGHAAAMAAFFSALRVLLTQNFAEAYPAADRALRRSPVAECFPTDTTLGYHKETNPCGVVHC